VFPEGQFVAVDPFTSKAFRSITADDIQRALEAKAASTTRTVKAGDKKEYTRRIGGTVALGSQHCTVYGPPKHVDASVVTSPKSRLPTGAGSLVCAALLHRSKDTQVQSFVGPNTEHTCQIF
jgi:hypothetical protein